MRTLKAFTVVAALHLSFLFFLFSSSKDRSLRLHVDASTLFSSTRSGHHRPPPPSELVPVEALAMVDDSHEATRDREMQEIVQRFGQAFFDKSVSYSGTNHRLRRILRRAMNGESIAIAVLGGSITVGNNTPKHMAEHHTYHAHFWEWWQATFPAANHSYHPAGLGGFGSNYFANCFLEHIPEDVDLVIIDAAVNDQRFDDQHRSYDALLRSVLTLPSAPAVIAMEFFAIPTNYPMTTGGTNQLDSSRYMDIPSLSLRNPLLPELLLHPSRIPSFFGRAPFQMNGQVDPRHPCLRGHLAAGNILKHHVWQQLLYVEAHNTEKDVAEEKLAVSRIGIVDEEKEGVYTPNEPSTAEDFQHWQDDRSFWAEEDWGSRNEELEIVPRMALLDPFHPSAFIPTSIPRCRSLAGTREKLVLISTTKGDRVENGTVYPGEGDGWFEWESSPQKKYVISRSPKAEATFAITVGLGDVKIAYLMSSTYGLGSARCWVDDDRLMNVRLVGLWEYPHNIGRIGTVKTKLSPGHHLLHCLLVGDGEFRISSVITG